jgi:hypothetical protein
MNRGTVCKGAVPKGPLSFYLNLHFWVFKDVRKYLFGFCDEFDKDCCEAQYSKSDIKTAVERGYLNLLKRIVKIRKDDWRLLSSKKELLQVAISKGHLNIVIWIQESIAKQAYDEMCEEAIEYDQLEVFKYAMENGGSVDEPAIRSAVFHGRLVITKWLIFNGKSKQVYEVLAKPFGAGIDEAIRLKIEEWERESERERGTCAPL